MATRKKKRKSKRKTKRKSTSHISVLVGYTYHYDAKGKKSTHPKIRTMTVGDVIKYQKQLDERNWGR